MARGTCGCVAGNIGRRRRGSRGIVWEATGASVGEDVDEAAEGVADVEAAHAPGLVADGVLDAKAQRLRAGVDGVDVVDLDREVRDGGAGAALTGDADLGDGRSIRGE